MKTFKTKTYFTVLTLLMLSLAQAVEDNFDTTGFDFEAIPGPFQPTMESLGENYQCPEWFRDTKFGIYMHWGLNSVSGYNAHYARYMYHQHEPAIAGAQARLGYNNASGYRKGGEKVYQYHVKHFGHPSMFGYKDFIGLWKAKKFDALALATLYKEVGARYIGVMAVHHDNFDLFDSTYQSWNSVRMGPKIDIVGAWKAACEKLGLRLAITTHLSNHHHEHWFYQGETDTTGPLAGVPYDTVDPRYEGLYGQRTPDRLRRLQPEFALSWYRRTKELIDKYNPDLLYLDGGLPNGDFGLNLAAHFYNHNTQVNGKQDGVMTVKNSSRPLPGFTVDVESAGIKGLMPVPWQVDTSIHPGWFYLGGHLATTQGSDDADRVRLTAGQVIDNLIDIVSKNGNMMLNVGLRPDGSLPETFRRELLDIGAWLKLNGEAIYETRPYTRFGEGPSEIDTSKHYNDHEHVFTNKDIRFTTKGKAVYAIIMAWPGDGATVTIRSLASDVPETIASVSMLATGETLTWTRDQQGLHITLPDTRVGDHAYVIKVKRH